MPAYSRDLDRTDSGDGGALCDEEREEAARLFLVTRVDGPPDRVVAVAAGGECRPPAQRRVLPAERGEHDAALARFVAVVDQESGHSSRLPCLADRDIGATP